MEILMIMFFGWLLKGFMKAFKHSGDTFRPDR